MSTEQARQDMESGRAHDAVPRKLVSPEMGVLHDQRSLHPSEGGQAVAHVRLPPLTVLGFYGGVGQ
jgi:hypothetical protein